ncbi:alpha/beta hydrolase, partial [Pseudomonas sp. CrR25]|nr:alpha/beta hydrolase [Pseudomonas sp. CrR25]
MPERFKPDHLRPLLRPLAAATLELPAVQAYRAFYGIDLGQRHAHL